MARRRKNSPTVSVKVRKKRQSGGQKVVATKGHTRDARGSKPGPRVKVKSYKRRSPNR